MSRTTKTQIRPETARTNQTTHPNIHSARPCQSVTVAGRPIANSQVRTRVAMTQMLHPNALTRQRQSGQDVGSLQPNPLPPPPVSGWESEGGVTGNAVGGEAGNEGGSAGYCGAGVAARWGQQATSSDQGPSERDSSAARLGNTPSNIETPFKQAENRSKQVGVGEDRASWRLRCPSHACTGAGLMQRH